MKWTKENILDAINNSNNYKDVMLKLNMKPSSHSYMILKKHLYEYSISFNPNKLKTKEKWKKDNLINIIKNSTSYSQTLIMLGLIRKGDNIITLKKYIKLYNIDVSHFNLNFKNKEYKELNNILIEKSTYTSTSNLKNRLYKEGLKERKCEKCGQDENWNGEHMSLILDHINGINDDNRIENLRIVCPNCNATLDTHCGKNVNKKEKILYYCKCGNIKSKKSKCCSKCIGLNRRKSKRPSYNNLLFDIKQLGYSGTGRKYGVSDNAIRKWILKYE